MNNRFQLDTIEYLDSSLELAFSYIVKTDQIDHRFVERLAFPEDIYLKLKSGKLDGLLRSLHLMLSVSYWKIGPFSVIEIPYRLNEHQASFWKTLIQKGMREFLYRGDHDPAMEISFLELPEAVEIQPVSTEVDQTHSSNSALIPFGGGKDSFVSIDLVRTAGVDAILFLLRPSEVQKTLIQDLNLNSIEIGRTLDPEFLEMSRAKKIQAGHVPMTAIYTMVATLVAAVNGIQLVVLSNEQSASEGNLDYKGVTINHQWSKSYEAEQLLQSYLSNLVPSTQVFSILRPMSEFSIIDRFVKVYPEFLGRFTSCNRNFLIQQSPEPTQSLWCGNCPKCAFVYLLLGLHLPKDRLIEIFGQDLLEKKELIPMYEELAGISGVKPFECVGTFEEVQLTIYTLNQDSAFSSTLVIRSLFPQLPTRPEQEWSKMKSQILRATSIHLIPSDFQSILHQQQ